MASNLQNYNEYGDFQKIAQFFTDYDTAWGIVRDMLSPVHQEMLQVFWSFAFPVAMLVLAYHILKADAERAGKMLLYLFVVTLLLTPIWIPNSGVWNAPSARGTSTVDAAATGFEKSSKSSKAVDEQIVPSRNPGRGYVKVAGSIHYFNQITDGAINLMLAAIDKGFGQFGKTGDFRAPMGAMSVMSQGQGGLLDGTQLKRAVQNYWRSCSHVAAGLSAEDARSVGLLGGTLGRVSLANKLPGLQNPNATRPAVEALSAAVLKNGEYIYPDGQYIEDQGYWERRMAHNISDTKSAPDKSYWTVTAGSGLRYEPWDEVVKNNQVSEYEKRFYAKTCKDLYLIAENGMRQYNNASNERNTRLSVNDMSLGLAGAISKVAPSAIASATAHAYLSNTLNDDGQLRTGETAGGIGGGLLAVKNFVVGAVAGTSDSKSRFFEEFHFENFAMMIPIVISSLVGMIFVLFPFICLVSLFPGRESLVPNSLFTIAFLKLIVPIAYLMTQFGGLMAVSAQEVVINSIYNGGNNLVTAIAPWVTGAQWFLMLSITAGAPMIAYRIIFNETAGLAAQMKFGSRQGGDQVSGATMSAAAATATAAGGRVVSTVKQFNAQRSAAQGGSSAGRGGGGGSGVSPRSSSPRGGGGGRDLHSDNLTMADLESRAGDDDH